MAMSWGEDDEMKSKETKNSKEMEKQRTGAMRRRRLQRVWRWPWWHRATRMSHPHPNNKRIMSFLTCRMEGMTENQVNAPSWSWVRWRRSNPPQPRVYFWLILGRQWHLGREKSPNCRGRGCFFICLLKKTLNSFIRLDSLSFLCVHFGFVLALSSRAASLNTTLSTEDVSAVQTNRESQHRGNRSEDGFVIVNSLEFFCVA